VVITTFSEVEVAVGRFCVVLQQEHISLLGRLHSDSMLELLCDYWLEVSMELDDGDGKCSVPQPIDPLPTCHYLTTLFI
jgi:hypothetical protein